MMRRFASRPIRSSRGGNLARHAGSGRQIVRAGGATGREGRRRPAMAGLPAGGRQRPLQGLGRPLLKGEEAVRPSACSRTIRRQRLRFASSFRQGDNTLSAVVPSSVVVVARSRYFPPFSRALRVLTSRGVCRNSRLDVTHRRGDRGRLRADFHGPPRPAWPGDS